MAGTEEIGVVVRSVGERTEALCLESIRLFVEPFIVSNVRPVAKAILETFELACSDPKDWYLVVDADVVLMRNWYPTLLEVVEGQEDRQLLAPIVYDFITNRTVSKGLKLYRGTHIPMILDAYRLHYDTIVNQLKPGDWLRRSGKIRVKSRHISCGEEPRIFGLHACAQYRKHIFNTAAVRGAYAGRRGVTTLPAKYIVPDHQDRGVAIAGFMYGVYHQDTINRNTPLITIPCIEEPCKLTLQEFYDEFLPLAFLCGKSE